MLQIHTHDVAAMRKGAGRLPKLSERRVAAVIANHAIHFTTKQALNHPQPSRRKSLLQLLTLHCVQLNHSWLWMPIHFF